MSTGGIGLPCTEAAILAERDACASFPLAFFHFAFFLYAMFIPLRGDQTVTDVELAHPRGSGFFKLTPRVCDGVAAVINGVILTPILDHAVMSRSLFKIILDHDGSHPCGFCQAHSKRCL